MPTYLYWGDEDFNLELAVKRLRKKLLNPDWVTFNHKVFDAPSIQTIIEAASTIPMGFGDVLIEIHNLNIFSRRSKSNEKTDKKDLVDDKHLKQLLELIPELPDRVNLLFVVLFERNSKRKIDKGLKTTKTFLKYGVVQQFESFSPFKPAEIVRWIKDAAKEYNVKINNDAAMKLQENAGVELRKINSELKKLAAYKGEGKTITLQDVNLLCSGIENVFVLLDQWVKGNRHDAFLELSKMLDKEHPVRIIASLQSNLTQYLHIKLALQQGQKSTNLHQELNIHQYRLKKTIEKLRNVDVKRLAHLRNQLTIYENKIKTGQLNAELAIEILMTM